MGADGDRCLGLVGHCDLTVSCGSGRRGTLDLLGAPEIPYDHEACAIVETCLNAYLGEEISNFGQDVIDAQEAACFLSYCR